MVSPFRELTEAAFWVIEREVAASEALSRRALAVGRPGDSAARPLRGTARRGRRRRGAIPGILQPARAMPSGGRPRAHLLYGYGLRQAKRLAERGWAGTVAV